MTRARYPLAEKVALGIGWDGGEPIRAFAAEYARLLGRQPSQAELRAAAELLEPPPVPPSASSTALVLPELLAMRDRLG